MATAKLVPTTPTSAATFARREKLRLIMRQAWAWARHGAAKFGGSPLQYLAEALRIVWAEKKKLAREIAESRARVLAEHREDEGRGRHRPAAAGRALPDATARPALLHPLRPPRRARARHGSV